MAGRPASLGTPVSYGRAARITGGDGRLPTGSNHSFRYLAAGDYWFSDDTADEQDGPNSLIRT